MQERDRCTEMQPAALNEGRAVRGRLGWLGLPRLLLVGVLALIGVLVAPSVAHAATSHQFSDDDRGKKYGEAWFNSGTTRSDIGRNSFTVKNWICNDGIQIMVEWEGARNGYQIHPDCGEESFSIETRNVARAAIQWHVCRRDMYTALAVCEKWITDYID